MDMKQTKASHSFCAAMALLLTSSTVSAGTVACFRWSHDETSNAACKSASQDIYISSTSECKAWAFGGAAVGAGGVGGAAWLSAGPWGLGVLAVGAIGAGAGSYGASSCYNDAAALKDRNYAICDMYSARRKELCDEERKKNESNDDSDENKEQTGGGAARDASSSELHGPLPGGTYYYGGVINASFVWEDLK